MYIVTSRDRYGIEIIIWYFKKQENAIKEYKALKKLGYKRVNVSLVLKIN